MSQTQDTQDVTTDDLEAAFLLAGMAVAVRALGIAVDQIEFERPVRERVETLTEGGATSREGTSDGAQERIRPGMGHTVGTLRSGEAIAIVHYAGFEAIRLLATKTGAPKRHDRDFWNLELPQVFEPDFRLDRTFGSGSAMRLSSWSAAIIRMMRCIGCAKREKPGNG